MQLDSRTTTSAHSDDGDAHATSPAAGAGRRNPGGAGPTSAPTASVGGLLGEPAAGASSAAAPPPPAGDDPFGLHLEGAAADVTARVDAAVARAASDPRGAHRELLAVYQSRDFARLPAPVRARVMIDLGSSFHTLEDTASARLHFEAALASGALDARGQARALEGLRRARGGANHRGADAPGGGEAPDATRLAALEARIEAAIDTARHDQTAGVTAIASVYRDPDMPHLPPRVRARLLFAHASAHQRAHRYAEAVSLWEEAMGSGLLDAEHLALARDLIQRARAGHDDDDQTTARSSDLLAAMLDAAVALQPDNKAARDSLYRVYLDPGFRRLPTLQRGRCLYNLAASLQNLGEVQAARNFWLEALNSGGLDDGQRARANDHIRDVMPTSTPEGKR
jgi:tetratricopeptide (TPR) repeat protein